MTDPKPAAAVPTILGREVTIVTPGERRCTVNFGALEAGYAYIPNRDGSALPPFNWWIKVRAHEHRGAPIDGSERTEPEAIEAIERALLAMRDAIPWRQREPAAAADAYALKRVAGAADNRDPVRHKDGHNWYRAAHIGKALVLARGDDSASGPEAIDAAFIAAASPTRVLSLIAELEQLRAGAPKWIACLEDMPSAGVPVLIRGHAWPSPVVASLALDERLGIPSCWSDADGNGEVYYLDHVHYWSVLPELPESLREAEAPLPSPPEAVKP